MAVLRRLDAFRLAPVGQRAVGHRQVRVEPRLEPEIAHLLRGLQPAEAGLDAAARVERAVEHAEVRVAATGRLQQIVRLGQPDAVLDLVHRLGQAAGARERDAERVVGLRSRGGGLARALGLDGAVRLGRHFREGPLGPCDGGGIVAGPKREPTHLLKEVRTLDRIAVVAEPLEARREAASGALAIARFPVESADLAVEARGPRAIPGRLDLLRARLRSARGPRRRRPVNAEQIGEPLARDPHLGVAVPALAEGAERALVVADRIVVRVDRARPVAGGQQIARHPWACPS